MSIKERRLRRDVAKKQEYHKKFGARIKKGDRETPSYAEWTKAGATKRAYMQAGLSRKKLRRMK